MTWNGNAPTTIEESAGAKTGKAQHTRESAQVPAEEVKTENGNSQLTEDHNC